MRPSGMVWPGASAPSLKSQHPSILVHFVTCIRREHPSSHGAAVPHWDLLCFTLRQRGQFLS